MSVLSKSETGLSLCGNLSVFFIKEGLDIGEKFIRRLLIRYLKHQRISDIKTNDADKGMCVNIYLK